MDVLRDCPTLSDKCRDLHSKLVSTLTDIGADPSLIIQALVDDVYTQVLAQIEPLQAKVEDKRKQVKGPAARTGQKRKRKRYLYGRTQDLFRKSPNLLGRHIHEGTPWLEHQGNSSPSPQDVQSFCNSLWGEAPEISIVH
jgi:hypothetical protein